MDEKSQNGGVEMLPTDRLMLESGLTRSEFCKKYKIPRGTWDTWVYRKDIPKKAALKVCHDLGVTPEWVWTGAGEKYLEKREGARSAVQEVQHG